MFKLRFIMIFNKNAFDLLAKDVRRASWGVMAAFAALGYHFSAGVALVLGSLTWTALQVVALLLNSIEHIERGDKS